MNVPQSRVHPEPGQDFHECLVGVFPERLAVVAFVVVEDHGDAGAEEVPSVGKRSCRDVHFFPEEEEGGVGVVPCLLDKLSAGEGEPRGPGRGGEGLADHVGRVVGLDTREPVGVVEFLDVESPAEFVRLPLFLLGVVAFGSVVDDGVFQGVLRENGFGGRAHVQLVLEDGVPALDHARVCVHLEVVFFPRPLLLDTEPGVRGPPGFGERQALDLGARARGVVAAPFEAVAVEGPVLLADHDDEVLGVVGRASEVAHGVEALVVPVRRYRDEDLAGLVAYGGPVVEYDGGKVLVAVKFGGHGVQFRPPFGPLWSHGPERFRERFGERRGHDQDQYDKEYTQGYHDDHSTVT